MRHIANLKDLSADELHEILDKAAEIKASPADFRGLLAGQSLAMIFQKTSTRTRVSFEVGMTELGGHAIYLDWVKSNFVLAGIELETEYLSRNVSCIMARMRYHEDLLKIIKGSQVPVINGCCEKYHPCQALTDVLTISENTEGNLTDVRLAYVGVQNNVSNSLTILCDKLGINLTLATPEADDNGEARDADVDQIIKSSKHVEHTTDPRAAVADADFVYTDTWIDMQYFNDPDHKDENDARLKRMMPYQLNQDLIGDRDVKIMHDMPIHEGFEIEVDMVRDPRSIIFDQAANRAHAQKGLLWWLYQEAGNLG
jgi:ornithine carbamoyltransferase